MPELPEVENLRIGLSKRIVGQRIRQVIVRAPKLVSGSGNLRRANVAKAQEFVRELTGETISSVERRAKNLIFNLVGGKVLLVHLKMSGQFVYREDGKIFQGGHPIRIENSELHNKPGSRTFDGATRQSDFEKSKVSLPGKHTHIIFELNKGVLYYNDVRTFGYLLYFKNNEALQKRNHFKNVGPEPLSQEFSLKYFAEALKEKHGNLKSLLLGQSVVAGLGNIYADEVCYEAGVRPARKASSLKDEEISKLFKAIKRIIKRAIQVGGSSVATYMLLDESRGNYAREHKVYGKSGGNCANCKNKLSKMTLAGRTTVFCRNCQK